MDGEQPCALLILLSPVRLEAWSAPADLAAADQNGWIMQLIKSGIDTESQRRDAPIGNTLVGALLRNRKRAERFHRRQSQLDFLLLNGGSRAAVSDPEQYSR